MTTRRFVEVADARHYSEFVAITKTPLDQLRHELGMFGDGKHSTLVLGALPEGKRFIDLTGRYDPPEYMQSAGSRDALTVEASEIVDGQRHLYALGRDEPAGREVTIRYGQDNANSLIAHENEVFTSDEAAEIFLAYMDSDGTIPDGFTRREIEL